MDVPSLELGTVTVMEQTPVLNTSRRVLLASPCGFCAGEVPAVLTVSKALDLYGPRVYARGEIVHNKHAVDGFKSLGVVFLSVQNYHPHAG